jgi:uncharacterized membrane protein
MAGAAIAAAVAAFGPMEFSLWRAILTVPLVIVYPGYALLASLGPRHLSPLERCAFTLAASLGLTIISGLALDRTPWGLTSTSWSVALGGFTITLGVAALVRRKYQALDRPIRSSIFAEDTHVETSSWRAGRAFDTALFGLALVLVSGAFQLARSAAVHHGGPAFTQFWLDPGTSGVHQGVRVGVRSFEHDDTIYTVVVRVDGQAQQEWSDVMLRPNEAFERAVPIPPSGARTIEAILLRADRPAEIYRRLHVERSLPNQ